MALEARLESLGQQHKELEAALNEEMMRPAYDELKIHDLKRRKLAIKDEMEVLRSKVPN